MKPTRHVRDTTKNYPTSICGVGSYATLFEKEDEPATCRLCLDKLKEKK